MSTGTAETERAILLIQERAARLLSDEVTLNPDDPVEFWCRVVGGHAAFILGVDQEWVLGFLDGIRAPRDTIAAALDLLPLSHALGFVAARKVLRWLEERPLTMLS